VYLQVVIKGKLSTVSMTKGRGCPGPYTNRKQRTKDKHVGKHIKHSTNSKGCLSKGGNVGEQLARWNIRLGEATQWVPNDRVGCRAT
jgi:hypothetical protein